jgi:hypothetical protein
MASHTTFFLRMPVCHRCHQSLPASEYSPSGLQRRRCKKCCLDLVRASTRGSEAKHLLANLRARCRANGAPEGSVWLLQDVEALLAKFERPKIARKPRLRIVPIDPLMPLLPDNAAIRCFGQGLSILAKDAERGDEKGVGAIVA